MVGMVWVICFGCRWVWLVGWIGMVGMIAWLIGWYI
jgi:hypothetical protein